MRVGAEDVLVAGALHTVLAVVAGACQHPTHGSHAAAQIGPAGVVLEAHHRRAVQFLTAEHIIADHAFLLPNGIEIQRPGEVALLTVPGLVIVPQHLIAAADAEEALAVLNGSFDLGGFLSLQIRQEHLLLEVLSAADKEEIVVRRPEPLPDGDSLH